MLLSSFFVFTSPSLCRNSISGGYMTQPYTVMINKLVVMVIKLHPFFFFLFLFFVPCGRSRLMYLVTACDDKVSYYPTSRNFKITMNILRNQSGCVQSSLFLTYLGECLFECVWWMLALHIHLRLCSCAYVFAYGAVYCMIVARRSCNWGAATLVKQVSEFLQISEYTCNSGCVLCVFM